MATPVQIGVGDSLARWVYNDQPVKFAAIELVPTTSSDVPETLLGHLNADGNERPNAGRPRSAQCGTESGYGSHRYYREPACGPCKAAHSAYVQSREAS